MRVVLITSEVTFVPENYSAVVEGLVDQPNLAGLILLSNRNLKTLFQALTLILTFSAPRLGAALLYNWLLPRTQIRKDLYKKFGKFIYFVNNINSVQTNKILHKEKIDLVLNTRTEGTYSKELLAIPPMGCYNIHHGIFPYQRGQFCDFWAHYDQVGTGFSIHKMATKIEDGDIVIACKVNSTLNNYVEHLRTSAKQEQKVSIEFLRQLEKEKSIMPLYHIKTYASQNRKNPQLKDFYAVQSRGIRI